MAAQHSAKNGQTQVPKGSVGIEGLEVSAHELGGLLDLTDRRIRQLARDGEIPRTRRGRYAVGPAVRAYKAYLEREIAKARKGTGHQDYAERLEAVKTERAELELAKMKHEVVDRAAVRAAWQEIAVLVRNRLLAVPAAISTPLAVENEKATCQAIVEREIHQALEQLSQATPSGEFD